MAASPPPDVSLKSTGEEINFVMETDEFSAVDSGRVAEKEDIPPNETDDPFKKPAIFSAPSITNKRGNVTAASRPPAAVETRVAKENDKAEQADVTIGIPSQPDSKNVTRKLSEERKKCDKELAPAKPKSDAKLRVLPGKGPPAAKFPPLPYTEPPWGGKAPDDTYELEILKNGAIVDKIPLSHRGYFVVGRLPVCDVSLEHPSISRYHAVIQYRGQDGEGKSIGEEKGFYVQDLGSTHGTVVNKNKIPSKTYIRLRVGHVLKFGGSTRLFILQGPEFDEEEESELTVTELRERAQKQREELEKRMMGDGSDDDDDDDDDDDEDDSETGEGESNKSHNSVSTEDSGCSWGMAEEAVPEEDENEENPFSTEFHEDQEAAYLKDPKKALQGFYDREGEELEFEYEDKSHGTWLCRIKLPVDDALGRQLVAEVTHTGKKKEAAIQCCLEACRMLEARGLLRQEAVSRKRKKKNWADDDYYDSDDDTFLDRTGTVERKRQERMKKAGKIDEQPETFESLVAKLSKVEKELADAQKKLSAGRGDSSSSSTEDPLDAFMTAVKTEAAMDAVERRKLHVHVADLRKDVQKLHKLVELTRPAQMPSLLQGSEAAKTKKTLPLFGAMKGGCKLKLKTGTIGKLPAKRPNLPAQLFNMNELPPDEEEEEEDENATEQQMDNNDQHSASFANSIVDCAESSASKSEESTALGPSAQAQSHKRSSEEESVEAVEQKPQYKCNKAPLLSHSESKTEEDEKSSAKLNPKKAAKKKVMGPSRPPVPLSTQYPEDDPDYSVWVPPANQTGDGRTHLNDKYGY
ncbi:kanadaptin [Betta splendens]|uniref:Kanadaptin n=1 Tax=Betta splendens TaxID=158456 RepID=A0A6P7LJK6_BETSP|nr:kanadaptin [Betta splendens]